MSNIIQVSSTQSSDLSTQHSAPLALPELPIKIRQATMDDLPFIDSLQKKNTKKVGFLPTKALEGKITLRQVLVAEKRSEIRSQMSEVRVQKSDNALLTSDLRPLTSASSQIGYLIGNDQYYKRDDLGCIFQVNIVEEYKRHLVAASLIKAQFEASAWGCKLYCCWCAQDLEANRFWEAMGFVALAYRVGAEMKGPKGPDGKPTPRVHIFWQKRIRAGDTTTPYWFPSKTAGGELNANRVVLPIPPGVKWSDQQRLILQRSAFEARSSEFGEKMIEQNDSSNAEIRTPKSDTQSKPKRAPVKKATVVEKPVAVRRNGLMYSIPKPGEAVQKPVAPEQKPKLEKVKKARAAREKCESDPKLVAFTRELRDRWLEEVNSGRYVPCSRSKYDVCRLIGDERMVEPAGLIEVKDQKLLAA